MSSHFGHHEVVVLTLGEGTGLEDTQEDSDRGREQIAATVALGVSTKRYDVLRFVLGNSGVGDHCD